MACLRGWRTVSFSKPLFLLLFLLQFSTVLNGVEDGANTSSQPDDKYILNPVVPSIEAKSVSVGSKRLITLAEAIEITLKRNPNIDLQRESLKTYQGQERSANGAFNPALTFSTKRSLTRTPDDPNTISHSDTTSMSLGIQQTLPSGISLQPQITATRNVFNQFSPVENPSIIGFTLNIPLLQGLGPHSLAVENRNTAKSYVEYARLTLEYTISQQLNATLNAYINCLNAQSSLEISQKNEDNARRLVSLTNSLIKGYAAPAFQIHSAQGNLQNYTSQKIQYQQQLIQAGQQLAIALGLNTQELEADFLTTDENIPLEVIPDIIKESQIPSLVLYASHHRSDLSAYQKLIEANEYQLLAAKNGVLPQLNLNLFGGYKGISEGNQLADYSDSLNHNLTGVNTSGTVSLSFPLMNDVAEGNRIQKESALKQAKTNLYSLQNQISSSVISTATAVINNRSAFIQAVASEKNQIRALEAQERLFALGTASIIDVITSQTNLANAQLNVVNLKNRLLTSVADLRLYTGTSILKKDVKGYVIKISDLLVDQIDDNK